MSHENEKHGLVISNYISSRGTPAVKAECAVDFPIGLVYKIMNDSSYKPEYDKMMAEHRLNSKLATNTYTIFTMTRQLGKWPLSLDPRALLLTNY